MEADDKPFPAAKVGIIAGLSAAAALTVVCALLYGCSRIISSVREDRAIAHQAAEVKKQAAISPAYKAALHEYLALAIAEHAAARSGYKTFKVAHDALEKKTDELVDMARNSGESLTGSEARGSVLGFSLCADSALEYHLQKLSDCEKNDPISELETVVKEADLK